MSASPLSVSLTAFSGMPTLYMVYQPAHDPHVLPTAQRHGAEAGVPASAERRAASMMFGGNWGPGTRHILTVNGTMLNYG